MKIKAAFSHIFKHDDDEQKSDDLNSAIMMYTFPRLSSVQTELLRGKKEVVDFFSLGHSLLRKWSHLQGVKGGSSSSWYGI